MSDTSLWPAEYLSAGIAPDHCRDVLAGCYDVALSFDYQPTILDLGANIGAFARWAAERWPGATIHCYEPHPGNFALLEMTAETLNATGQVAVFPYHSAVMAAGGRLALRLATTNCGAHSFFDTGEVGAESLEVEAIPATGLPLADILKLDTEGAELEILEALAAAGRLPTFSAILLEYHHDAAAQKIHALLTAEDRFRLVGAKRHCTHRGELRYVCRDLCQSPAVPLPVRPRLYIATPSHDHKLHANFAFSLYRLLAANLFPIMPSKVGGAGVARARNNQAAEFLKKSTCDLFFCIDADIGFEPAHVQRLVDHNVPIVCGMYPLKQHKLAWCVNTLPGETVDESTGLQKVASAGTGFMCVQRWVLERMCEAHPEIAYVEDLEESRGDIRWDFFSMGVDGPGSPPARLARIREILELTPDPALSLLEIRAALSQPHLPGRYLTEDWYFCHRARALGIPVYLDCSFYLQHQGMIDYPLEPVEMS